MHDEYHSTRTRRARIGSKTHFNQYDNDSFTSPAKGEN